MAESESSAAAQNLASANTPSPDTIAEAEFWAAASNLESANAPNTKADAESAAAASDTVAEAESAAAAGNLASTNTPSPDTITEAELLAVASNFESANSPNTKAEVESAAAASNLASANTPTSRPEGILATARRLSKCKARTLGTARAHLKTVEENGPEVVVGLLGDSMIERMRTTGRCDTLRSWPSDSVLSDYEIQTMNDEIGDKEAFPLARIEGVANFGCGGDKIQNVLYRVVGDPDEGLKGLVQELHPPYGGNPVRRNHKLWVVQAGTNNLHPKRGLKDEDLYAMEVLLRTLHHMSRPGTKFLLTGLFYRTDISKKLVDEANAALQNLVTKLGQEFPEVSQSTEQMQRGHERKDSRWKSDGSWKPTATGQSLHHGGVQVPAGSSSTPHSVTEKSPAWGRPSGTFGFLPAPRINDFGDWLEDKVHFHHEGYRKWMHTLLPKVGETLPGLLQPVTPQGRVSHFTKDNVLVLEGSSTDS